MYVRSHVCEDDLARESGFVVETGLRMLKKPHVSVRSPVRCKIRLLVSVSIKLDSCPTVLHLVSSRRRSPADVSMQTAP